MVLFEILNDGGWMMWVILLMSIIALGLSIERSAVLYGLSMLNTDRLLKTVVNLVEQRDYAAALEACSVTTAHPLPYVLKAGLERANCRDKEIEKAMEGEMLAAVPRTERGLGLLSFFGNAATLLGLLGTIFGLIQAFSGVSAASASERQEVLAAGISVAMYTTAFGIIAALPVLFFHTLLSGRAERILTEMEEGATRLTSALAGRPRELPHSHRGAA